MRLVAFLGLVVVLGCAEAQQGTAKVLDNANSVVRSGSGKLWIPSGTKPESATTATTEQKKKEEEKAS